MCSKWLFGDAKGNNAVHKVIGNFSIGDDEFLCKGKPTEPKGARFTQNITTLISKKMRLGLKRSEILPTFIGKS